MNESRFVVLRHDVGTQLERTDELHFDWMFQVGGTLRTWATCPVDRFDRPVELSAWRLADHRTAYLDYTGVISGNRGAVTQRLTGSLVVTTDDIRRFAAQLSWTDRGEQRFGQVVCQRINDEEDDLADETRGDWSLLFSPGR